MLPPEIDGLPGVISIETKAGGSTVNETAGLTMAPDLAVISVLPPSATLVAKPPDTMVAKEVFEESHVTEAVRSCVLKSV